MIRKYLLISLMLLLFLLVFNNHLYMASIKSDQHLYEKGINFLDNNQSPFALDYFYKVIKNYPNSRYTPKSISKIMQTKYFFQEYNKVINLYEKHEKLIKKHMKEDVLSVGDIYPYVLASYYDLEKYDKILNFSDYVGVFKDTNNEKILLYLASAALRLDKYSLFEKYDNKITSNYSKSGLGFILYEKGRVEQSFKYFNYFLNNVTEKDLVSNNGVQVLFSLGYVYLKTNRGKQFQKYLNPLLEKISYEEENLDKILFILGKVQMGSNLHEEAKHSFEKIKKYYPDSNLIEDCNNYIKELDKRI